MTFSGHGLTNLYRREASPKVRERLLLILMVKHDGILSAHSADQLHRIRPWALYWLDRFSKEGINGLKDRSKSGRPSELSSEMSLRIRKNLKESKQGWTTKLVRYGT